MKNNIRVEIKIKNNILYNLIINNFNSIREFCKNYDLSYFTICNYLNLRHFPKRNHKWTKTALRLSEIFKILPEDIFDKEFDYIEKNMISLEGNLKYIENRCSIRINYDNIELQERINKILNTLPARERKIIELRYGLNGNYESSLSEIGNIMGISKERVRQIEKKAKRRIEHPTRSKYIKEYIK